MPSLLNFSSGGGVYNSTTPVLINGQRYDLQVDANGNLLVSLNTLTAGEDLTNNVLKTEQRVNYTNDSISQLIKSGTGRLFGWTVNSHTNGTLKFWDNTSALSPVLINTITFATGPGNWTFPIAITFTTGLFVTIGGTINYTIFWQ